QGGLAAPVGADDVDPLSTSDVGGHPGHRGAFRPRVAHGYVLTVNNVHAVLPSRRGLLDRLRMNRKNGATPAAVTSNTGSSCGARMGRPMVSAVTRKIAPHTRVRGSRRRWPAPNKRRTARGTTMPTTPM